jgi:hypothetical protein
MASTMLTLPTSSVGDVVAAYAGPQNANLRWLWLVIAIPTLILAAILYARARMSRGRDSVANPQSGQPTDAPDEVEGSNGDRPENGDRG